MTPDQFHSYLIGSATSVDHLAENGVDKNLQIASAQPDSFKDVQVGPIDTRGLGTTAKSIAGYLGGKLLGRTDEQIASQLQQAGLLPQRQPVREEDRPYRGLNPREDEQGAGAGYGAPGAGAYAGPATAAAAAQQPSQQVMYDSLNRPRQRGADGKWYLLGDSRAGQQPPAPLGRLSGSESPEQAGPIRPPAPLSDASTEQAPASDYPIYGPTRQQLIPEAVPPAEAPRAAGAPAINARQPQQLPEEREQQFDLAARGQPARQAAGNLYDLKGNLIGPAPAGVAVTPELVARGKWIMETQDAIDRQRAIEAEQQARLAILQRAAAPPGYYPERPPPTGRRRTGSPDTERGAEQKTELENLRHEHNAVREANKHVDRLDELYARVGETNSLTWDRKTGHAKIKTPKAEESSSTSRDRGGILNWLFGRSEQSEPEEEEDTG